MGIDREIAEKVMGWEELSAHDKAGLGSVPTYNYFLNEEKELVVFMPSTSIQDAWLVIDKMRGQIFSVRMNFNSAIRDIVSDRVSSGKYIISYSEILLHVEPKDICLAALAAIGDK